jgi:hypothetical protein
MDHEIAFPNPIERADLPVPRKKWKYILATSLVLLAVAFALLPQILSSKLGRNIVKAYLESKFRGQAFMTDFRTTWFGPTEISKFAFNDPQSRQIRFQYLSAPIGVLDLLRGNYDLHGATIKDLYVDWVVDYGDGTDTLVRLTNKTNPGPHTPAAPVKLPNVHGEVSITNALVTLSRGIIEQKSQFRTNFRTMRFANIEGTFNIQSLDQPFSCNLKGTVGGEGSWGTFTLSGNLDLGENGYLDLARGAGDVRLAMQDVPNHVGNDVGSLLYILVPAIRAEHYEHAFGQVLNKVEMDFTIGEGKLRFSRLDVQGRLPENKLATLTGKPVIDLAARPYVLTNDGDITASVRLSRGIAESLVYVNPFFIDAITPSAGEVDLTLTKLHYPLRVGVPPTLAGTVAARNVPLASGQVLAADKFPRDLTTQWQAVTGNFSPSPTMTMPPTTFSVSSGYVTTDEYQIAIDDNPVTLRPNNSLVGKLRTRAVLSLSRGLASRSDTAPDDNTLDATIVGNVAEPQLELPPAAASSMAALIDHNIQELKARKAEQLLQKSQHQVDQLLSGFDRMKKLEDARH